MKFRIKDRAKAKAVARPNLVEKLPFSGKFSFRVIRKGKVIDQWESKNTMTIEGLNHMLDVEFHGTTQQTTWYLCIFSTNNAPSTSNTYVSKGNTESSAYDESTRPAWNEGAASSGVMASSSVTEFTISSTVSIYGVGLVSNSTKGDSTSDATRRLMCSSLFSVRTLNDDDVLQVEYSLTGADT